jgi:hypothetical protein
MLTLESHVVVPGLTGAEVTDFLLQGNDAAYQAWWPGVHLQLHPVAVGGPDHVGDTVFMDEFVGSRRIRMTGVVRSVERGRRLVWQMKKGIVLPVWLTLTLADGEGGVSVCHTITAGWNGAGRLLDPLLRLYFTRGFAAAMDRHAHTEFTRLRDLLRTTEERNSP